jgi:heptosyltransferase-2
MAKIYLYIARPDQPLTGIYIRASFLILSILVKRSVLIVELNIASFPEPRPTVINSGTRILIIAPNWIGDAVMSQPLIAAIKQALPACTIDVLTTPWVAPIYRACVEVNHLIEAPLQHGKLQWQARLQLAKQLRLANYACCFILPNSLKAALIPWLAKIPVRIGYRGEMRFGLINRSLANPSKANRTPMVEHYANLLRLLPGLTTWSMNTKPAHLQIPTSDQIDIQTRFRREQIALDALYVFSPGAEFGPAKRWPIAHFAKLASLILQQNARSHIIILGGASDAQMGQLIQTQTTLPAASAARLHNWCGTTSLNQALATIANCQSMISNDSGLMHVAAALQISQVAIFGSSDPRHTAPQSSKARVIWLHLSCSPCYQRTCPLGTLACLQEITPTQVFAALNL